VVSVASQRSSVIAASSLVAEADVSERRRHQPGQGRDPEQILHGEILSKCEWEDTPAHVGERAGSGVSGGQEQAGAKGISGSGAGRPYKGTCHDRPRSRYAASDLRPRTLVRTPN
jgi:hypothetical protein